MDYKGPSTCGICNEVKGEIISPSKEEEVSAEDKIDYESESRYSPSEYVEYV